LRLNIKNLIQSVRILTAALAFLIVILVGAATQADPLKLLVAALFVYVFFYILGLVVSAILRRIHEEVSEEPLLSTTEGKEGEALGQMIDFSQEAEFPIDKGTAV